LILPRRFPMPRLAFSRSPEPAQDGAERFRTVILPHLDAAYGYARYLTRDGAAAEDIVQEAFLRAYRAIGNCRGNEKAWLLAIVRNCHHDWARSNGRYRPGDVVDEQADEETPLTQLERASDVAQVRASIEALPEPFREALVLRELEGLPYRDIAEMTGVPIGTVMSRLARARRMLAAALLGEDIEDKGAIAR
jgi:RNA polymerase sigma factor (sigma-70 family)